MIAHSRRKAARAARVVTFVLALTLAGGAGRALAAPPGSPVVIRTTPSGAAVILDGEVIGRTPWSGFLADGGYELELALEGHERFVTTLLATGAPMVIETALLVRGVRRAPAWPLAASSDSLVEPARPAAPPPGLHVAGPVAPSRGPSPALALSLTIGLPLAGAALSSFIVPTGQIWAGVALVSASLTLLPSVGHLYLKAWPKALAHAGLRVVAGGAIAAGTLLMATGAFAYGSALMFGSGLALTGLSAAALLGSIIYESVEVWRDATAIRRARAAARPVVGLAPLVASPWGAGPGATVMVAGF